MALPPKCISIPSGRVSHRKHISRSRTLDTKTDQDDDIPEFVGQGTYHPGGSPSSAHAGSRRRTRADDQPSIISIKILMSTSYRHSVVTGEHLFSSSSGFDRDERFADAAIVMALWPQRIRGTESHNGDAHTLLFDNSPGAHSREFTSK